MPTENESSDQFHNAFFSILTLRLAGACDGKKMPWIFHIFFLWLFFFTLILPLNKSFVGLIFFNTVQRNLGAQCSFFHRTIHTAYAHTPKKKKQNNKHLEKHTKAKKNRKAWNISSTNAWALSSRALTLTVFESYNIEARVLLLPLSGPRILFSVFDLI